MPVSFTVLDMSTPRRDRADACPGALATHQAADGALARVRLPAGRVSAAQLRALGECAATHGDGVVYLTSRANVQLRGLRADAEHAVVSALTAAGLLPVPTHERVRNYVASAASGYFGGMLDVRAMLGALDTAVCAHTDLARLPGRFLFGLDDGRGDVAGSDVDVCWQALDSSGARGRLLVADVDTGLDVPGAAAVAALVCCAAEFQRHHGEAWRVRELPAGPAMLRAAVLREVATVSWSATAPSGTGDTVDPPRTGPESVGTFDQHDGRVAVVVASPFGELSTAQIEGLAAEAGELVVTPSRTIVVPGIMRSTVDDVVRRLSEVGFGVDPSAGWLAVSSCVGAPRCAKANADVRARAADVMSWASAAGRVHFSGCERRCGRPVEPHTDVLATEHGYRLDGVLVPEESLLESLSASSASSASSVSSVSGVEREQREGP